MQCSIGRLENSYETVVRLQKKKVGLFGPKAVFFHTLVCVMLTRVAIIT